MKMKKFLYLMLLLLPLGIASTSCSDDDDLPDVDVTTVYDNVVLDGKQLYVVKGDTLKVLGVTCKGNDGKQAVVTNVNYALDGFPMWRPYYAPYYAPYGMGILTGNLEVGKYVLSIGMNILQVDKTMSSGVTNQVFNVVETAADLPSGVEPGKASVTVRFAPK